jgi:hypothetical protein
MPDSTDNARGPDRIWIDPHGGNWSGREGGTQEVEYTRADLAPDPLADARVAALVEAANDMCLVAESDDWPKAMTGRQIIFRNLRAALDAFDTGGNDE